MQRAVLHIDVRAAFLLHLLQNIVTSSVVYHELAVRPCVGTLNTTADTAAVNDLCKQVFQRHLLQYFIRDVFSEQKQVILTNEFYIAAIGGYALQPAFKLRFKSGFFISELYAHLVTTFQVILNLQCRIIFGSRQRYGRGVSKQLYTFVYLHLVEHSESVVADRYVISHRVHIVLCV